jgi:hypothetical protein
MTSPGPRQHDEGFSDSSDEFPLVPKDVGNGDLLLQVFIHEVLVSIYFAPCASFSAFDTHSIPTRSGLGSGNCLTIGRRLDPGYFRRNSTALTDNYATSFHAHFYKQDALTYAEHYPRPELYTYGG